MQDAARAEAALQAAASRAGFPYHQRWILGGRIILAQLRQDVVTEEAAYQAAIALEPQEPHSYSNYAGFLKRHKRYDEAMAYYE